MVNKPLHRKHIMDWVGDTHGAENVILLQHQSSPPGSSAVPVAAVPEFTLGWNTYHWTLGNNKSNSGILLLVRKHHIEQEKSNWYIF
jgi:hypothetical protein